MKSEYKPSMLESLKPKIKKEHPLSSDLMNYQPDQEFLEQIKKWAKLPQEDIEETAQFISSRKIWLLVNYIPTNSLKLPLENLVRILYLRVNTDIARRLFVFWQDYFLNRQLCGLLYQIVQNKADIVVSEKNVNTSILERWFSSDNIPQAVGKECMILQKQSRIHFPDRLRSLGISPSSKLGQLCIAEFLTFCDRVDYLEISDSDMLQSIKKFSPEVIASFLKNILTVLEITDFQRYFQCGKFLRSSFTGSSDTQKYQKYFSTFSAEQEMKYRRWLNYILVHESFAANSDEERLEFWSRYVPYSVNVYRVPISESLVLEFEMYCIIEFPEKTKGPLYIYEREVFENKIKRYVTRNNNAELRRCLYNELREDCAARIIHRDNWQFTTRRYLVKNRVI